MRSGPLRRRINVQQQTSTIDGEGSQSTSWVTVLSTWAAFDPVAGKKGQEVFAAQMVNLDQGTLITVRYNAIFADPKAVAAMRVQYGSRLFNIHEVKNLNEMNRTVQLLASEGMNNG